MRTIFILLQKEFIQILRNKQMLPMIFAIPIVQLIILGYAATLEIKNINYIIVDKDHTELSQGLTDKFAGSDYFVLKGSAILEEQAYPALAKDDAKLVIVIPKDFEKNIVRSLPAKIQFIINAEDGSSAGMIMAYTNSIVIKYNVSILTEFKYAMPSGGLKSIDVKERFWYNSEMDYKKYMAPGILVILVTFIGMFLAGLNVVKEKEMGTIEQLNVTPIKKYQFIIGKLLPFWLIGLFELAFGLLLAVWIFDVPVVGSLFLLAAMSSIYLLVVLGAALLISTISDTQQQAMFISWFFIVVFILMSGIFTPIESMPLWAQHLALINPIAHFAEIFRRVLLKGSAFSDIHEQFMYLSVYAVLILSLAVWRYKKVS